ncbi:metalloregulator ArsR/SmtB family transcription factor [Patulibacter brassicae]|uniref:Metalloregulator ArsR/SmtB family transcription factor n=1 Tax=Patulibacter brassicae TaxID=1705717 RepID=A0ABU4VQD9_9ACTN|nr:metalloregulator ArsR/SmtB family transcription factor [Patulibacter brassicae]MDX8153304.1 metalloregulator ArsR/SmtB family transcription factor [Patulibacter brassicae]
MPLWTLASVWLHATTIVPSGATAANGPRSGLAPGTGSPYSSSDPSVVRVSATSVPNEDSPAARTRTTTVRSVVKFVPFTQPATATPSRFIALVANAEVLSDPLSSFTGSAAPAAPAAYAGIEEGGTPPGRDAGRTTDGSRRRGRARPAVDPTHIPTIVRISSCPATPATSSASTEALRRSRPAAEEAERLAERAAGLGDPTRLVVALALRDGEELCVCDLSWVVERPEKVVSHHVRKLRAAGLVTNRREGRMVMYRLTPAGAGLLDALTGPAAEVPA